MKLPTYFSDPQVQTLQQIIEEIQLGGLLLPQFQRPFEWTDEQRLLLLQSVREGLPIGSILVWRTTEHELKASTQIAGSLIAGNRIAGPPWQYLLDGHQRLTTLVGALAPRRGQPVPLTEAAVDELNPKLRWDIYFDLKTELFAFRKGISMLPTWVPTHILLDSIALLRFQREMVKAGVDDELIDAADRLALAVRNYKIPVVPIVSNDLPNVTVAFQRVNSGGTTMSDADIVMALSYGRSFDLRAALEEATERLRSVGWSSLEDKYLLAVVRLRADLAIAKPDAEKTSNVISRNPELIRETTDAIIAVANFLRAHCYIAGPNAVPYSYQSVLLAEALRENPEPSAEIAHELCRWFWATTYSAYFLGARDWEITQAAKEVRRIVSGETPAFANSKLNIEPLPVRYDFRAARCKAFITRLAELQPSDTGNRPFDAAAVIARSGPDAFVQLLSRRTLHDEGYSAPENRFLLPPEDASHLQGRIITESLVLANYDWLSRHLISTQAMHAWENGDHDEFLRQRRSNIEQLESEFLTRMELPLPVPPKNL